MSGRRFGFGIAVFLGAFLLFQIQPMVARAITPSFGGSAMVWTTCMVFFQTALLGGYLYAHLLSRLSCRRQALIHVALLPVAFLTLEFAFSGKVGSGTSHPALDLVILLSTTVGPAFLLVSATAPLVQRWFAAADEQSPYRLYALSNAGSLLGLLCYPFVVEPLLSLNAQSQLWKGGFLLLTALFAALARFLPRAETPRNAPQPAATVPARRPSPRQYFVWLLLAAAPSALLLAVTNKVSVEIAPVPLLWVVPLSLYLATFILAFDHERWYRPTLSLAGAVISLLVAGLLLQQRSPHVLLLAGALYSALFFCCLTCHGELSSLKPDPGWLTEYFLTISAGGVLGGMSVGILSPQVFDSYDELLLAFAGCVTFGVLCRTRSRALLRDDSWPSDVAMALAGGLATAAWISPELVGRLLSTLGARRGSAIEYLAFTAPIVLALIAVIAWRGRFPLAGRAAFDEAAAESGSPREESAEPAGLTSTFLRWSALILAILLAFLAALFAGRAAVGWVVVGQSPLVSGLTSPLFLWAICLGVSSLIAGRPAPVPIAAERGDQTSPGLRAAVVWPGLFAAAGATLLVSAFQESLIASSPGRWLLLVPMLTLGMSSSPFLRASTPRSQRGMASLLLAASAAPAFLLWRGMLIPFGSGESFALAATLVFGCFSLGAGRIYAAGQRRSHAFLGFVGGLGLGLLLAVLAPEIARPSMVLPCSILALMVLTAQQSAPRRATWGAVAVGAVGLACGMMSTPSQTGRLVAAGRSFYSVLRVEDIADREPARALLHGNVTHGMQLASSTRHNEPTTYYHRESGIGRLLLATAWRPRRVGVVGLGAGTLAAYGRPGDHFRFFEIDPLVVEIAQQHFDFLRESEAEVDFVIGDGRLALEKETETFDILILDAFTGDVVPTHLLTAEAVDLALRRLSPDGILAMHLSNTHIDLTPVINGHARRLALHLAYIDYNQKGPHPRSLWAILSRREIAIPATPASGAISDRAVEWTDQHHSLLPLIRFGRTAAEGNR